MNIFEIASELKALQVKLGLEFGSTYREKGAEKNPHKPMKIIIHPKSGMIVLHRKPKITPKKFVDSLGKVIPPNLREQFL